jgi:hypothetical protein
MPILRRFEELPALSEFTRVSHPRSHTEKPRMRRLFTDDPKHELICNNLVLRLQLRNKMKEIAELEDKLQNIKADTEKFQGFNMSNSRAQENHEEENQKLDRSTEEFYNSLKENIEDIQKALKYKRSFWWEISSLFTPNNILQLIILFFIGLVIAKVVFQSKAQKFY